VKTSVLHAAGGKEFCASRNRGKHAYFDQSDIYTQPPGVEYFEEEIMSPSNIISTPLKYLDKAVNGLRDLGLLARKAQ